MSARGKVALITGAASGIGRAAADLFARRGANVVIADINSESGEKVAAELRDNGTVIFIRTDITDPRSVEATVARTVSELGSLDILYNNAGGSLPEDGRVVDVSDEAFWRALQVDLYGTWLCCKYGIPTMIKTGGGAVVNTASMVALIGYPGMDAYTAAKGAVAALTRSMAVEYAPFRIRVNAVAPGMTLTERGANYLAAGKMPKELQERHVLGLLEPQHIAQTALFLATDASGGMTGQVLSVDSGLTIT